MFIIEYRHGALWLFAEYADTDHVREAAGFYRGLGYTVRAVPFFGR